MIFDLRPGFSLGEITAYDIVEKVGVVIQEKSINDEEVLRIDGTAECDWIFDCSNLFYRRVLAGNYAVCEVGGWGSAVSLVKNNVFLYTGFCWIYLENKTVYNLEIEGLRRSVFIGTEFSWSDLCANTCLQACLTEKGLALACGTGGFIDVPIAYARCRQSMALLDDIHRDYIQDHDYVKGDVIVVKAGAGSGKTTTQLTLAKRHSEKRILYLAFNKSLVGEIEGKLASRGIKNMSTMTFDALLRRTYIKVKGSAPEVSDLKPQTIAGLVPWLQGKAYKLKNYYCKNFSKFCSDVKYSDIKAFCKGVLGKEVPILEELWAKVVDGSLVTFDSIRKLSFLGHWFKQSIDREYDMIFVDEIQDFDMAMLRMLLDDTTIPKLFVGDPRQSIYEWRGCINAFEYMPIGALTLEFYSTFRIGEPALSEICSRFKDCYMISKASHETRFGTINDDDKYVYLFRSWKQLLTTARETRGMWIFGFEQKIIQMRNLHEKLQFMKSDDDLEFEDDLPAFLRSMSSEELDELICDIGRNTVSKEESQIRFYTIHSYKGMEDAIIRVANDVTIKEEPNLYYVAITRGMQKICMDEGVGVGEKEMNIMDLLMNTLTTKTKKKAKPITENPVVNKVKKWTAEEDAVLLEQISKGFTYESIAELLGRSVLAIEFHLRKIGSDMVLDGTSVEQALLTTKIDRVSLEEAIDELRIKNAATKKGARWEEKDINKMLGLIKTGTSINNIAIMCGRSVPSVKEKLYEQAGKYGSLGFSIDDIMKITGLNAIEVNSAIVAMKRKSEN